MINRVCISAVGCTDFTRESLPVDTVMFDAVKSLFQSNHNISRDQIDAVLISTNDNSKYLGAVVSESVGIQPKTTHSIESMCSSGTSAIASAYAYIASGLSDIVLVVGGDRYDGPGHVLEWDESRGSFRHPIFWASLFTRSYKDAFGIRDEDLASIPAKNHRNAQDNPNAISRNQYSISDVLESRAVTDDLRLLECSRPSTGGAALLMTSEQAARHITDIPVWITGIGQRTVSARLARTGGFTSMQSTLDASRQALMMAGIGPKDIDVAEVHDAFAVCEALALEDIGFAERGRGASFARYLYDTGDKKINPRGGLIGAGHPPGATGVAQTVEIASQLQNNAGKRQADSPKNGLVHNMSAAATSSTVLVMSN